MTQYWRPGYSEDYKKKLEKFLETHKDIPIDDPREFMKFCTDQTIMEIITKDEQIEEQRKQIEKEIKEKLDNL